jgi:hypothetical protein
MDAATVERLSDLLAAAVVAEIRARLAEEEIAKLETERESPAPRKVNL